jgi:hypothetical protein
MQIIDCIRMPFVNVYDRVSLASINRTKTDRVIGGLLLIAVALIFWFSPNHQIADSRYSMLVSESLLQHRSFMLDFYQVPHLTPTPQRGWIANGNVYQMEWIDNHLYYFSARHLRALSAVCRAPERMWYLCGQRGRRA